MWFSAFHHVFVCIFRVEWIYTITDCKTFIHVRAGLHTGRNVCSCMCAFLPVFMSNYCTLSVALCALWSLLLAAVHKENCWRLLGFPHRHQNTKHSPTLLYSLPANTIDLLLACVYLNLSHLP